MGEEFDDSYWPTYEEWKAEYWGTDLEKTEENPYGWNTPYEAYTDWMDGLKAHGPVPPRPTQQSHQPPGTPAPQPTPATYPFPPSIYAQAAPTAPMYPGIAGHGTQPGTSDLTGAPSSTPHGEEDSSDDDDTTPTQTPVSGGHGGPTGGGPSEGSSAGFATEVGDGGDPDYEPSTDRGPSVESSFRLPSPSENSTSDGDGDNDPDYTPRGNGNSAGRRGARGVGRSTRGGARGGARGASQISGRRPRREVEMADLLNSNGFSGIGNPSRNDSTATERELRALRRL